MSSSEVSPGFNRLPGHLRLTNGIVRRAPSRRLRFELFFFHDLNLRVQASLWVSGTEQKPQICSPPSLASTVGLEPARCNKVHVILLLPFCIHLVAFRHERGS